MSPEAVESLVLYQIAALEGFVRSRGAALTHVKPHGALYHAGGESARGRARHRQGSPQGGAGPRRGRAAGIPDARGGSRGGPSRGGRSVCRPALSRGRHARAALGEGGAPDRPGGSGRAGRASGAGRIRPGAGTAPGSKSTPTRSACTETRRALPGSRAGSGNGSGRKESPSPRSRRIRAAGRRETHERRPRANRTKRSGRPGPGGSGITWKPGARCSPRARRSCAKSSAPRARFSRAGLLGLVVAAAFAGLALLLLHGVDRGSPLRAPRQSRLGSPGGVRPVRGRRRGGGRLSGPRLFPASSRSIFPSPRRRFARIGAP